MDSIKLLSLDIREAFEGDKFHTALTWLPESERPSVTRFKFERDQKLALGSLLLRRHYFSELLQKPWLELEFDRYLPGGKPYLKGQKDVVVDFNVSHEGNWVIFGVSFQLLIGIDTVTVDRTMLSPTDSIDSFVKSFHSQLTGNEMQLIQQSEDQLQTFFELWGCKESYIKAIGVGLNLELNKLDFTNENNQIQMSFEGKRLNSWCFHLSYLDDKSIAVICCGSKDERVKIDPKIIDFSKSTKLLGSQTNKEPLHVFHNVRYQDIQNNKWLSRN